MKTEEKYEPNLNQNNESEPTKPRLEDPVIQAYIDTKKQEVYTTEEIRPIKKRDLRYFGRLGAESAKRIGKELEEENKQTKLTITTNKKLTNPKD